MGDLALSGAHPAGTTSPSGYKWKVLFTVIFGFFMILLDMTVVNVAFPVLRQEFGADLNEAQWIISVYIMAMGISMPLSGFLANRFGSKTIYLSAIGLFTLGSLLCGLSSSLFILIAARVLQGIGGGIAMPLGTALLLQAFPVNEQGTALGIYGIAALVAPALGPVMGGWFVGLNLWRLIFFINVPVGLIAILFGARFLRQAKSQQHLPLDLPGVISSTVGFGAILYAASLAADAGWTSPATLTWFAVGAAGLTVFTLVELFVAKFPLLDLRLFGNRTFLNASLLGYVATWALFGAEFLLPLYLQVLRGQTALATGFILLPLAITSGVLVILSGKIYDRVGPRPLMVVGFAILAVNTWQLAQLQADTSIRSIIFLLALRGIALGLTAQTTMATALSVVPHHKLPMGSSLIGSTRQVVQSIGVAVLATILASTLSPQVRALQNQFASSPRQGAPVQNIALCSPAASEDRSVAAVDHAALASVLSLRQPEKPDAGLLRRACQENVDGFEKSYRLTFYASLLALVLGLFLPGWPFKWSGRQVAGSPLSGH
jgi:EmrB/QacA subfamily drug resistance transporter